ncbi:VanZ family protein [Vibrio sp. YIC-376]|uniref:VanZ family protein n=1 Tax=Vibrio sp. YIC-376 TaxID=3136162 RepID=UPI00402A9E51
MSSKIARISFVFISLLTASLSIWKSSEINHSTYISMENYVGGSTTLHFTFSLMIGFFSVFTFPKSAHPTETDVLGIRLLLCLLLIISAEEFSQLFIAHRTFSFDDLNTNWIGMLLGYFAAKILKVVRQHSFFGRGNTN